MNFTYVAEQSSQGPVSGGITGSARKGVKRKLDDKSLEIKYEVLMEVEKGVKTKKQIADHYGLAQNTLSTWLKKADGIKNAFLNSDFSIFFCYSCVLNFYITCIEKIKIKVYCFCCLYFINNLKDSALPQSCSKVCC